MTHTKTPINAHDASFERAVLHASLPVAAVFWSAQETPREQLNRVLEEIASLYAGEVQVVKLDVADAPQARADYQVEGLPQFLFFRRGKLVARAKGMPDARMLRPWLEYLLERGPRPVLGKRRQEEAASGGAHPVIVMDADFERVVLGTQMPVLVDFWASWCQPCRMVAPVVEELAQEFAGRALVAKLDVDANLLTAQRYAVQGIPTLILFRDGREVERVVGVQPVHVLRRKLEALL